VTVALPEGAEALRNPGGDTGEDGGAVGAILASQERPLDHWVSSQIPIEPSTTMTATFGLPVTPEGCAVRGCRVSTI
jgi:hypothetical protein